CMVGAVAFTEDGTLLVAAQERLVVVRPDGTRKDSTRVVPAGKGRRMNDGAVDPDGRFVVGTLALDGGSEREQLVRLEPDGSLTERVDVPAPHTSAVTFAGDDLRTLVVTTASEGLTDDQRAAFPDSGRLFTVRADVGGIPPTAWKEV